VKHLPLKLGIAVVLLFAGVIVTCLLWTPLKTRYYSQKFEDTLDTEWAVKLAGLGKGGKDAVTDVLKRKINPPRVSNGLDIPENATHVYMLAPGKTFVNFGWPKTAEETASLVRKHIFSLDPTWKIPTRIVFWIDAGQNGSVIRNAVHKWIHRLLEPQVFIAVSTGDGPRVLRFPLKKIGRVTYGFGMQFLAGFIMHGDQYTARHTVSILGGRNFMICDRELKMDGDPENWHIWGTAGKVDRQGLCEWLGKVGKGAGVAVFEIGGGYFPPDKKPVVRVGDVTNALKLFEREKGKKSACDVIYRYQ